MTPDLFQRAREKVSIGDYLARQSVTLKRSGALEQRGPCVLCDGDGTRFVVKGERWKCWGCGEHGDVVELVAQHLRMTGVEAARWLLGEDVPVSSPPRSKPPASAPEGPSASDRTALEIWAARRPLAGTLAERYLLGRGIAPEVVAAAGDNLRYCGLARHHWDERAGAWVSAPALVAEVVVASGNPGVPVPTGGVHVTYLDRESGGKSRLAPAKKMWGPQSLGGRPGGAWLIGPDGWSGHWGELVVAEGIETALSVATLALRRGQGVRAVAALSLNRLQGGLARDEDGCIDPFHAVGDPRSPAFVWPEPAGAAWGEVLICVDRDMADQKARVRTPRRGVCEMRLTAEVRARICGQLAVAAWKGAGAASARAIAPPPGMDFNDQLRRVLASGSGTPQAARPTESKKSGLTA